MEVLRAQAAFIFSQARGQSSDIQRALAAAGTDATLRAKLTAAAAQLSGVAGELSRALGAAVFPLRPGDLIALESVLASGDTTSLLSEVAAQDGSHATAAAVASAAASTRQEVGSLAHDVFDQHLFDPYLRFSSPADREAFRRREAEAKRYVAEQLARRTPEGDLNAGGGMLGHMLDAHGHGAGDSPDFMPRWNALVEKTQRQHEAMRAAGQSTAEFDRHVSASVRGFLAARGLPDADIDARLAATANPLDAVKPFLGTDRDSRTLENKMELTLPPKGPAQLIPRTETTEGATRLDAPFAVHLDALGAKLKAAGARIADATDTGHGLSVQPPARGDRATPASGPTGPGL